MVHYRATMTAQGAKKTLARGQSPPRELEVVLRSVTHLSVIWIFSLPLTQRSITFKLTKSLAHHTSRITHHTAHIAHEFEVL